MGELLGLAIQAEKAHRKMRKKYGYVPRSLEEIKEEYFGDFKEKITSVQRESGFEMWCYMWVQCENIKELLELGAYFKKGVERYRQDRDKSYGFEPHFKLCKLTIKEFADSGVLETIYRPGGTPICGGLRWSGERLISRMDLIFSDGTGKISGSITSKESTWDDAIFSKKGDLVDVVVTNVKESHRCNIGKMINRRYRERLLG